MSNATESSLLDSFIDEAWSPENPVPARYRDKKVQVFGLSPNEDKTNSSNNKNESSATNKQNDTTESHFMTEAFSKHLEMMINRAMANAALGVSQKDKDAQQSDSKEVKTSAVVLKPNAEKDSEAKESESEESNDNETNLNSLAELFKEPAKPTSTKTNSDREQLSNTKQDDTEPNRELLDSLLNLPPSLLDQAAKSLESGQITPEALASLLRLRPDLLGESASKIDTNQITPNVIKSLLKLRMTFMQSGGDSQAFNQFAKGSPDDLVNLMKVMTPSDDSKNKTKSKRKGKATKQTNINLGTLLGGNTGETEVKPTTEPAILPNLLTLVKPQLLNLIGLDLQRGKQGARPQSDRVKSHRFGVWRPPRPSPHHRGFLPQRHRRPSNKSKSKLFTRFLSTNRPCNYLHLDPILRAVSKGLEGVANHFQRKAKFIGNLGK